MIGEPSARPLREQTIRDGRELAREQLRVLAIAIAEAIQGAFDPGDR